MTLERDLEHVLGRELERAGSLGLLRRLELAPPDAVDFTSNDYLGLARHPDVIAAAREALAHHGVGGRAARLLGGGSPLDRQAEEACARWLDAGDALLFASGYQANLGLITALVSSGDLLVSDARNHASIIDAARLSRAQIEVVPHLDVEAVEHALTRRRYRAACIVTEGIFSMDGDAPALRDLADLAQRYGAWLVVDEAHACGLLGPEGAGSCAASGIDRHPALVARVVTGGKALGVQGAFAVGSALLCQHLVQRARSFAYTTASSPAVAAALLTAIDLARRAKGARQLVREHARRLTDALGLAPVAGAIVPVPAGSPQQALEAAGELQRRGMWVRAVRPPTVPPGRSQLRLIANATQTSAQIESLLFALRELGLPRAAAPRPAPAPRMSMPLFVAGTDTGVGKTVVAALLTRAAANAGPATYWKPVQTGPDDDARTVRELAGVDALAIHPNAYRFALAAAPDQAAAAEHSSIELAVLRRELARFGTTADDHRRIVELAGGLCVPLEGGHLQIDWLERERVPMVLVARSGLGTLNHTLLSYEALRRRGIEPRALFLVGPLHAENRAALERLLAPRRLFEVPPFDPLSPGALAQWLEGNDVLELFVAGALGIAAEGDGRHEPSPPAGSLVQRDAHAVWHPYTQHGLEPTPLPVASAQGSSLLLEDGRTLIDAISSWWTCLHGHGEPRLVAAMAAQAAALDHVVFAGATHEPAVRLAEALRERAPAGLTRVFYTDNGSTAVEVALKIALQAHRQRGKSMRRVFIALAGAYHGDTFGAMAVGDRDPFFLPFEGFLFEVERAAPTRAAIEAALEKLGERCAGIILEPLVQGAGGMRMHEPSFLQEVRALCDRWNVPWIADEVMTGFGRTGTLFACEQAGVSPDMLCLAKGLTGGMGPLAATMARESWFDAFRSTDRSRALFHGHSFTANPTLCAVALASLELCEETGVPARLAAIGARIESHLQAELSAEAANSLRRKGGIVAFDLPAAGGPSGYLDRRALALRERAIDRGVLLRPLGNTVYAMPPASTNEAQCAAIAAAMADLARFAQER